MQLILLGAPGAGKGTLAVLLAQTLGLEQISTGDLFRKNISEQTPVGVEAEASIKNGQLVPDEVTTRMVREKLETTRADFVLDGYPRTIGQADALTGMMTELAIPLNAVIDLEVADEAVIQRLINRRTCSKCGAPYHLINYPPQTENACDLCGGALTRRADDNPETIGKRLQTYHEATEPLIEYYRARNLLLAIDGSATPEEVLKTVQTKLRER